jgi:isoaspartyl peptidase/L-asparaginase-like protein (Ntn-hydrolase superfamily)
MVKPALALHGGAGVDPRRDYSREVAHMRGVVEAAGDRLSAGASALDVAVLVVHELEESGLYIAGKGSAPNLAGRFELDAAVMNGPDRKAGAVCALQGFKSPIAVARLVMEKTPHVLLAGDGAAAFAAKAGAEPIEDEARWFTPAAQAPSGELAHGTVGCVVLDAQGGLAAATSTGGVLGKMPGRVGDAPLIGSGTWADDRAAVSATGRGEYFIRAAAAAQVAWRVRSGEPLHTATRAVLGEIRKLGGDGGLIAVDRKGNLSVPYNSKGMKRATLSPSGAITADLYD